MIKLRNRSGRGRRGLLGLALTAGIVAVGVLAPLGGTASAAPDAEGVLCGGKLTFAKGKPSADLNVSFKCNKEIKAFSIISSTGVDFFHSEAIVLDDTGNPASGEGFDCEGPIPGWGFGCRKNAATGALGGHEVTNEMGLFINPCKPKARKHPLRAWVTVTYDRLKPTDDSVFTAASEPFRLARPKCPPLPRRGR